MYYPIGFYRNTTPSDLHERGALFFLYIQSFMLFASTFTHMTIAGMESVETAGNMANLVFSLSLVFCGVLAPPGAFRAHRSLLSFSSLLSPDRLPFQLNFGFGFTAYLLSRKFFSLFPLLHPLSPPPSCSPFPLFFVFNNKLTKR